MDGVVELVVVIDFQRFTRPLYGREGLKGRGLPTPSFYVSLHFSGPRGSCLMGISYKYLQ